MTYPRFSYYTLHPMLFSRKRTRVLILLATLLHTSGRLCSNPPTEATQCATQ